MIGVMSASETTSFGTSIRFLAVSRCFPKSLRSFFFPSSASHIHPKEDFPPYGFRWALWKYKNWIFEDFRKSFVDTFALIHDATTNDSIPYTQRSAQNLRFVLGIWLFERIKLLQSRHSRLCRAFCVQIRSFCKPRRTFHIDPNILVKSYPSFLWHSRRIWRVSQRTN